MSLRRRHVRQISAVEEEDEIKFCSPTASSEYVNSPPYTSSPPHDSLDCHLSVALRRFSEYLVHKIETRDQMDGTENDGVERGIALGRSLGNFSRAVNNRMRQRMGKKPWPVKRGKRTPIVRFRPSRLGVAGTPPTIRARGNSLTTLVVAKARTSQDSPDLGDSGSDEDISKKKPVRKQSTFSRSARPGRTSTGQDGLQSMKKHSMARTATQQALRRRSTMTRSTAQAACDRQQRGQRRPSLVTKSTAPASESKAATAPKTTPKPSTGGAKMGPVRIKFECLQLSALI